MADSESELIGCSNDLNRESIESALVTTGEHVLQLKEFVTDVADDINGNTIDDITDIIDDEIVSRVGSSAFELADICNADFNRMCRDIVQLFWWN